VRREETTLAQDGCCTHNFIVVSAAERGERSTERARVRDKIEREQ
jgi:hypothetical protein